MTAAERENFMAVAHSNLARCFVTIDGQAMRPDSVFYIKGDADWNADYQHMLGTDGLPDGTPTMFRLNLKERLAVGLNGIVVSLRGHALGLSEPVVLKTRDNGEGYRYIGAKRLARLVYETWGGAIPSGMEVDHMNRVRSDDRLANLRLVTHSQNQANRKPVFRRSWAATDRVLLIPIKSGDPVVVHPSQAYAIVRDYNTWKLLHGQRLTAGGWFAIMNPTVADVSGYFKAYPELMQTGLLDACLALVT